MAEHTLDFSTLQFRYPFWRYQQMILEVVERQAAKDNKYHLVAPPGSGKTIVGLELVRRFGRPAVVFAPTTTIQRQWQEKLALFTPDVSWIREHTSLEAGRLAEVNFLTYQVLSTPGENLEFVERIARERWVDELLAGDSVRAEDEARGRIAAMQVSNPAAFRREISRRYRRLKREFLQQEDFDGRQFLHPNAQDLIARLVALGVGAVVLDECHHLLDYWAFILRELIKALPGVRVIGLTATLPEPGSLTEYENYAALLGEVDFEVPTPAVVKEGNLAPYRDLVYFCQPTPRESRYLKNIQEHFEAAVGHITASPLFQGWLWRTVALRQPAGAAQDVPPVPFDEFFNAEPALCAAGVRVLRAAGQALPADVIVIEEMQAPPSIDDWLTLFEFFGLHELKLNPDPAYQRLLQDLRQVLLSFGVTLTERGARHQRSPGELVLTLSESKDQATIDILHAESKALGERLRAVVITDFERLSAHGQRLRDVLDPDAGSAVRVFRRLIADPGTNRLDPVLVTGKVVLVDADQRSAFEDGIRRWLAQHGVTFSWGWAATDDVRILQLAGSGKGWRSRNYVALITALFEQGLTRCLVGTRGLFGEGWDALTLNTLINLTSVTTSTGVRQLRGRSLRLHPAWPRKVAHNWDVVCYSREFDKGDLDLQRLGARHRHTWGIIVRSKGEDLRAAVQQVADGLAAGQPLQGQVVRGVAHIDLELASELAFRPFKRIEFDKYTRRMLEAIKERERVYDLWQVGADYSNFIYSATQLQAQDLKFRTVYTVAEGLKAMVWRLVASLLGIAGVIWVQGALNVFSLGETSWMGFGLSMVLALGLVTALAVNARAIWQVFRSTFLELPADAVLLDIGRALLAALRDAGLVSRSLDDKYVRVAETMMGGFEVFIDYASPEDSDIFARAYRELLGPVGDARYLIERDSGSLRNLIYRPLWLLVRSLLRLEPELRAYHRVPDVLATRKERAEALARYWKKYVGGGRLVYTRSAEGRRLLLQARGQRRTPIRQMAFEFWK